MRKAFVWWKLQKKDGDKGVIVYLDTTDEVKCSQRIMNKTEPLKREV